MGIYSYKDKKPIRKTDDGKRKGWQTPYGFVDFAEPVSYEEACAISKKMAERFGTMEEK